ncbi:MAG: hypothetical protein J5Y07_08640 [Dehalobacter sp.]|uniref:Uncharacterized protein n=3 Tax=Dehalobacter restrictus TaxID=55583 RepID=A0A857DKG9_9FIRM|nr:hypothetical protein [Dehalobacter sp.]OCZ51408.1 hypothetical protein A7D23_12850 [Dehalobacter sp. TeCB1]QHA01860.1 hypothetical protein GQ588_03435 [Dehalobacter restrictus]
MWTSIDTIAVSQELMQQDIQTIKGDIIHMRQSQARVEHDLSGKVNALFDFRESQIETNQRVSERLERLEAKR